MTQPSVLHPLLQRKDADVLSRSVSYSGFLRVDTLRVKHRLVQGGWSAEFLRELQVKHAAIGMLLYDPARDAVVLVRQFRVGMLDEEQSPWILELVAGMIDKDETPFDVAMRETEEEAGCVPEQVFPITTYFNSPGTTNEKVHLFCGRIDSTTVGGVYGLDEENEDIEVVVLPFDELVEAVESGLINNAMTIIACLWLEKNQSKVIARWRD
jgi:ADP-ribose pyrophosphatase